MEPLALMAAGAPPIDVVLGIPPLILAMLISAAAGAAGSGIEGFQATKANRREAAGLAGQRARLEPILNRLRNPNFGSLDRKAVDDMSRASDQISSNRAASGMTDAGRGGADAMNSEVLSSILAQLAGDKQQATFQNEQLMAEILSNPIFSAPSPNEFNPWLDGALGFVGGAAAGAGKVAGTAAGVPGGLEGLSTTPTAGVPVAKSGSIGKAPMPGFGVKGPGLGSLSNNDFSSNYPLTSRRAGRQSGGFGVRPNINFGDRN